MGQTNSGTFALTLSRPSEELARQLNYLGNPGGSDRMAPTYEPTAGVDEHADTLIE